MLVIGAAGLGKTLLLEVLAQQHCKELTPITLQGGQLVTRRALLQMTLFQLGLPYREMDESELRLSLLAHLQPQTGSPRRILLLVDEADSLPPRLLEELRALTNLSVNGQLQVNLVLAGNSTLEEQFADPKLELFSQRVSARSYLSAFGREETFQFIRAQLIASGREPQALFSDDALEAIFAATDGVPRLVNQLCDQLMWMVDETGVAPLDETIVQQAWSELQQLPAPWNTQTNETLSGEVEFGELCSDDVVVDEVVIEDDDYALDGDDDMPASIPIHIPPAYAPEQSVEPSSASESLDVTEDLLKQLNDIEAEKPCSTKAEPPAKAMTNPFLESFDSEEVVLDRYSTFESLLLAEAPRVVNQRDASFSQQLHQLETPPLPVTRFEKDPVLEIRDAESMCVADEESAILADQYQQTAQLESEREVLIIEETEASETTLVSGQKFRQLFSSLESANNASCLG